MSQRKDGSRSETPRQRLICVHCKRRAASRARGLCWPCSSTPAIRELYPTSSSRYARRGHGLNSRGRLPDSPTSAPAGSEAKIAVLTARAAAGTSLWHPDDAKEKV